MWVDVELGVGFWVGFGVGMTWCGFGLDWFLGLGTVLTRCWHGFPWVFCLDARCLRGENPGSVCAQNHQDLKSITI